MSHKKQMIRNNTLYDVQSGSEIRHLNTDESENKYYAAVVMCGHCGREYFMPIMFSFWCKPEEVNMIARQIARVKRSHKDCILCSGEIDKNLYQLIEEINDGDGYLQPAFRGFDDSDVEERKIVQPDVLEEYIKERELDGFNKTYKRSHKHYDFHNIKTADMYRDYMVLQKTFAPRIQKRNIKRTVNGQTVIERKTDYVYPSKVKLDSFLDDYLTSSTFKYGIMRKHFSVVAMYYYIYGPQNDLGIKYDGNQLIFTDQKGEVIKFDVTEGMKKHLDSPNVGYKYKNKNNGDLYDQIVQQYGQESNIRTGLERFNQKFQKRLQNIESQPGEEE